MATSSHTGWRELHRPEESECPKLFYNFSNQQDSLDIKVTDLVAIWQCTLDRGDIVKTARTQHTSIDPSESYAQLRVLLDKLEQSLASGANYLSRSTNKHEERLFLRTNIALPKPLKALSWTFELYSQAPGELAEQLLRPCLHEAWVARQKLESLIRVIKDKDHVLSRLLEKLESSGTDLSLIFPGITGLKSRKGRITVGDAQRHVPGMAEFDQNKWSSRFENGSPYVGFDQFGMTNLVAGCERCPKHTVKQHDDWVKELPIQGTQAEVRSPQPKKPAKRLTPEPSKGDKSTDTESDFERQATPPHLKKKIKTRKAAPGSHVQDSSTDSEHGSSRPSKRPRLGKIGGLNSRNTSAQTSQDRTNSPEKTNNARRRTQTTAQHRNADHQTSDSDSETETEMDPEAEDLSRQSPSPINTTKRKSTFNELGKTQSHSSKEPSKSPQQKSTLDPANTHSSPEFKPTKTKFPPHPDSPASSQSPSPLRPRHTGKLNALGNKGRTTGPRTNSPPIRAQARERKAQGSDSETESDLDLEATANTANTTGRPASPLRRNSDEAGVNIKHDPGLGSAPPTPRKLGRLQRLQRSVSHASNGYGNSDSKDTGSDFGHNKTPDLRHNYSNRDSETETESEVEAETGNHVQGQSANQRHTRAGSKLKSSSPASTPTSKNEPEPERVPPRQETAAEAADRRRQELKSRLNTAGGGKKRRKF